MSVVLDKEAHDILSLKKRYEKKTDGSKINKNLLLICITLMFITLVTIGFFQIKSIIRESKINECVEKLKRDNYSFSNDWGNPVSYEYYKSAWTIQARQQCYKSYH